MGSKFKPCTQNETPKTNIIYLRRLFYSGDLLYATTARSFNGVILCADYVNRTLLFYNGTMKTPLTDEQQALVNSFIKYCLKGSTTQADDKRANEVNHLFTVVEEMGGVNIGFRACSLNNNGECNKYEYFVINN